MVQHILKMGGRFLKLLRVHNVALALILKKTTLSILKVTLGLESYSTKNGENLSYIVDKST